MLKQSECQETEHHFSMNYKRHSQRVEQWNARRDAKSQTPSTTAARIMATKYPRLTLNYNKNLEDLGGID